MSSDLTKPKEGYGPDFWRTKASVFDAYYQQLLAKGQPENEAAAEIEHWRTNNDNDVKGWQKEYKAFRKEARKMFEQRQMVPTDIGKWHALCLWAQEKSHFVGRQLDTVDPEQVPTLEMRRAAAYHDEALHVINSTEAKVFKELRDLESSNHEISLNLHHLDTSFRCSKKTQPFKE